MALKLAVPLEKNGETRVAASPETVKKFVALGCSVTIESGAGAQAALTDAAYREAGAAIAKDRAAMLKAADVVLCVRVASLENGASLKKGALVAGMAEPHESRARIRALADKGVTLMSMELIPRITRAQSMDVLSSQANLAGYKAVLLAAEHFGRAFPMMMTAAGTVPPARVFVMGAGVAGLQAIATARRLGAQVSATDVRPAVKEQVASLGAGFVAVEDEEFKEAETSGGYAREMSPEYKKKQQALIEETVKKQDIVITTALIPGRPAPGLISADMVKSMKPGSVIVDLAAQNGGNCALTESGKIIEKHGVTIAGPENVPGLIAADASLLYAKNLYNFMNGLIDKESGVLAIDWEDAIVQGVALTRDGAVVNPAFDSGADSAQAKKAKDEKNEKAALPGAAGKAAEKKDKA